MVLAVQPPIFQGPTIVTEKPDRLQAKETMGDEDGESELREVLTIPKERIARSKPKMTRTGCKGVTKQAKVIVLAMLRMNACDWCRASHPPCLPQIKGEHHLTHVMDAS